MHLLDYTIKLLGLSETIHRWRGALAGLEDDRREKVARYAEQIAATLARAAAAFADLEKDADHARAERRGHSRARPYRRLRRGHRQRAGAPS